MYYVYLLISEKDGNFYTGSTADLKRRFKEHNSGLVNSTKNRLPLKLIYYEACLNETDARNRERYLKSGMGKKYLRNRLKSYLNDLKRDKVFIKLSFRGIFLSISSLI